DARIVGPDLSYHALAGGSLSEFSRIMTEYGWWAFDLVSVHHYDDDGVPLGVRLDEGVQPFRFGKSVWLTETGHRWSTAGQLLTSTRGSHYNGVVLRRAFDLTGSRAEVRIRTPPDVNSAAQATLTIVADASDCYRASVQRGRMFFQKMVSGVTTTIGSVAF